MYTRIQGFEDFEGVFSRYFGDCSKIGFRFSLLLALFWPIPTMLGQHLWLCEAFQAGRGQWMFGSEGYIFQNDMYVIFKPGNKNTGTHKNCAGCITINTEIVIDFAQRVLWRKQCFVSNGCLVSRLQTR